MGSPHKCCFGLTGLGPPSFFLAVDTVVQGKAKEKDEYFCYRMSALREKITTLCFMFCLGIP